MSDGAAAVVLSGWGIFPEEVARLFPTGTRAFAPTRENVSALAGAERVVGYSLGAWLLLEAASRGVSFSGGVELYAPFLAFPREAGAGGRVSATQVKFLRRWMKKNPDAAIADFYVRAGLSFSAPTRADALPYDADALDEGLRILAEEKIDAVPVAAENWKIVFGENDALLDARAVAECFSKNDVRIVAGGTHDLLTLV